MFDGVGLFADGMMIGLVADGVINLKADEMTIPFIRTRRTKTLQLRDEVRHAHADILLAHARTALRRSEELARWAAQAFETARPVAHSGNLRLANRQKRRNRRVSARRKNKSGFGA